MYDSLHYEEVKHAVSVRKDKMVCITVKMILEGIFIPGVIEPTEMEVLEYMRQLVPPGWEFSQENKSIFLPPENIHYYEDGGGNMGGAVGLNKYCSTCTTFYSKGTSCNCKE